MATNQPADLIHARAIARRRASLEASAAEHQAPSHPLLRLQQQVGNAQVARMLAERQTPEEEEEPIQAKHDPALAQRQAPEEEEDVGAIQAKPEVGLEGGPVSAELSNRIASHRGGGAPLEDGARTSMESAFGTRFDDVRIHTGGEADSLNRSISAKAFTTGSDIFFSQNASPSDSTLLAHELSHVVQQRNMDTSGPLTVGPAGDSHEQAADATAAAVTSGSATPAQRQEEEAAVIARMLAERQGAPEEEEEMPT